MSEERVNKCQLTLVLSTGAQITVMVALHSSLVKKILETAIDNKKIAELPAVSTDEKVETDIMYVLGTQIVFFSLIQPQPESRIVQLGKKIIV